jgi:DNA-binding NarL/FixJ family response regulator
VCQLVSGLVGLRPQTVRIEALAIGISEGTVKFHANNLHGKLRVGSRSEALKVALEGGLIKLGPNS